MLIEVIEIDIKKVYFWAGKHPIHESILNHPPEGFEMSSNISSDQFITIKEYDKVYKLVKSIATNLYNLFRLPRVIWIRKPCDLIHTSSGVIPLNRKPWVVGVEHASSFIGLQEEKMQNQLYQRKVAKYLTSEYCKKVLPYSEACKKSIENAYKPYLDDFIHKLEVLYPSIEPQTQVSKANKDCLRILFISRHFFDDGGRELVRAFEVLERKYNLELYMIVGAPKHHLTEFETFLGNYNSHPRIHLMVNQKIPRKLLFERYYSQADIFVMPSYIHHFGYVLLEAMAMGLPLIVTDVFALPEIVEDYVNGFVIHSPLSVFERNFLRTPQSLDDYRRKVISGEVTEVTEQLIEKLQLLIEDNDLRKKMGKESRKMVENGKFSVAQQQKSIKRIYEDALRR